MDEAGKENEIEEFPEESHAGKEDKIVGQGAQEVGKSKNSGKLNDAPGSLQLIKDLVDDEDDSDDTGNEDTEKVGGSADVVIPAQSDSEEKREKVE